MELSRMKMKLQDTLASKTLVDDMNASLKVNCILSVCVVSCVSTLEALYTSLESVVKGVELLSFVWL